MKRMIVFDLDGTILNTLSDLKNALNYGLRKNGLKERSLDEVRSFVGNGIKNLRRDGANGEKVELVYSDFKKYYSTHLCDETSVYPNIPTLLLELKKTYIIGILSNKANDAVQVLNNYYFKDIFDFALGEIKGLRRKPEEDMLLYLLKKYNLEKKDVLYVGDSYVDIKFCNNAKIDYVIVDYGFRRRDDLLKMNPKKIVSNPLDIIAYLEEI